MNFDKESKYYTTENKKGKFKDGNGCDNMICFVGLKAKLNSILTQAGVKITKAKGVKKSVILTHAEYDRCLFEQRTFHHIQSNIRSINHQLYTITQSKVSLNCFDDKRYILDDGISTLAYGHHRIA